MGRSAKAVEAAKYISVQAASIRGSGIGKISPSRLITIRDCVLGLLLDLSEFATIQTTT